MKNVTVHILKPNLTVFVLLFSLLLAACSPTASTPSVAGSTPGAYGSSPGAYGSTPGSATSAPASGSQSVMIADNAKFGKILVTSSGMTLYSNTVDSASDIKCTQAACTSLWPPFIVSSMPAAVPGLSGQLGTATRPDGTTQLTYNDKPLYTFVQDTKPGDATGDGFTDLGGTWHVVTP